LVKKKQDMLARASAEKFPGGWGATEKRPKNSKKDRKTAILTERATEKRPKNNLL